MLEIKYHKILNMINLINTSENLIVMYRNQIGVLMGLLPSQL